LQNATAFKKFPPFYYCNFINSSIVITDILFFPTIAIPENNAIKTVQQSAKDKEGICRRADARQRYLTQDFTL